MVAKRSGNNNKIKKVITIADKVVLKATKSRGVLSFLDAMSPVKTFFFTLLYEKATISAS